MLNINYLLNSSRYILHPEEDLLSPRPLISVGIEQQTVATGQM